MKKLNINNMKPQTIEITVNRFDYPVSVKLKYTPGQESRRQGFERFIEPDDPPEIEILSIFCEDDYETELEAKRELNEMWLLDNYLAEINEAYSEKTFKYE